jgi:hypothetical protein
MSSQATRQRFRHTIPTAGCRDRTGCTRPIRARAVISRGERTQASAALAIAAGIVLARHARTTLIDDAHLVSGSASSEPETLLAAIRLRQPQDDLDGAPHRLLSKRGL